MLWPWSARVGDGDRRAGNWDLKIESLGNRIIKESKGQHSVQAEGRLAGCWVLAMVVESGKGKGEVPTMPNVDILVDVRSKSVAEGDQNRGPCLRVCSKSPFPCLDREKNKLLGLKIGFEVVVVWELVGLRKASAVEDQGLSRLSPWQADRDRYSEITALIP
ncbi:hypothetical protein E3N88_43652 [Mikania micrantha]|uniref:Uncharacterized protein n=1 Tax=Mikania micrantha TaxID=192012 RepID=A0A5N6LEC3_9ASTR|nr:hypothetical protein E3N88_43652 [Mikania micrantha]